MQINYFLNKDGINSVVGDYTQFSNIVDNLGKSFEDISSGKYIHLSEEQIKFMQNNPMATHKEIFNMTLEDVATEAEKLEVIVKITNYDVSDNVNTFYINDNPAWFKKELRGSIRDSLELQKSAGLETATLWVNDEAYELNIDTALELMKEIELYAIKCNNNTHNNINRVKSLTLRSELREFDITEGYPEKLKFKL